MWDQTPEEANVDSVAEVESEADVDSLVNVDSEADVVSEADTGLSHFVFPPDRFPLRLPILSIYRILPRLLSVLFRLRGKRFLHSRASFILGNKIFFCFFNSLLCF